MLSSWLAQARTASAGAAFTAESPRDDGETPAAATASNGTVTDTEAPANGTGDGTSNQATNKNAANDATAKRSGATPFAAPPT